MKFTTSTLALLSVAHATSAFAIPFLHPRQDPQVDLSLPIPAQFSTTADFFVGSQLSQAQLSALAAIRINPLLVPSFGVTKGIPVDGTADCKGFNGTAIPCFCPPNPLDFIQKLDFAVNQNGSNVLGTSIRFSNDINDTSEAAIKDRATACVVVLQNFNGSFGVGCPAASAPNFLGQQINGLLANGTVRDLIVAGVQ